MSKPSWARWNVTLKKKLSAGESKSGRYCHTRFLVAHLHAKYSNPNPREDRAPVPLTAAQKSNIQQRDAGNFLDKLSGFF